MQISIYLDIIFGIGFIVNLFVLWLTGKIARQKMIGQRVLIGAIFSSGMSLLIICFPDIFMGIKGFIAFLGISMGAVILSFGGKKEKVMKNWTLSTTIMILLGGIMNGLRDMAGYTCLQFGQWLLLFIGSSFLCKRILYVYRTFIQKEKDTYLVEIKSQQNVAVDRVFLDTGNMLWDPLFGKPVMLLSENFVKRCLSAKEWEIIAEYREKGKINYEKVLKDNMQKRICFHEIAYRSVGNPSGKLLCFLMEEIYINGCGRTLQKQPVAVGYSDLFEGKDYQGLLHRECI